MLKSESIFTEFTDKTTIELAEEYRKRKITSVLTIVFTDIANSTYLREQLGEIAYEKLREEYDNKFSEIVEEGEIGSVVKSTGDGALAVFSEPSAAVEKCLQVQRELGSHQHFKLRIGIDMGQVSVKSAQGIVSDVFGRHVNRASRIESIAEPGHILISFHVYDCAIGWLKGGNISWHNHGVATLKGFTDAISIHEVYDPLYCEPQSNVNFPAYEGPVFSKRLVDTRPMKLNKREWEDLYRTLKNKPISVFPLSATLSKTPFSYYTDKIRMIADKLISLIPETPSILWVDEFPDNNIRERRVLTNAGCVLDIAVTTEEAQKKINAKRYFLIITDMRRGQNSTAGLDLLYWLKERGVLAPSFVYTSSWAIAKYGEQAKKGGASLCTAGMVSLLDGISQAIEGFYYMIPREPIEEKNDIVQNAGGQSILFGIIKRIFHKNV